LPVVLAVHYFMKSDSLQNSTLQFERQILKVKSSIRQFEGQILQIRRIEGQSFKDQILQFDKFNDQILQFDDLKVQFFLKSFYC